MHHAPQHRPGPGSTATRLLRACVAGLALAALAACEEESAPPNAGVTIQQIVGSPAQFEGTMVTVSGEIADLIGPRAFTIGGDEFIGGDELLVLGAQKWPAVVDRAAGTLLRDDIVQVTGPVRTFRLAEVEQEIGTDLDDQLFTQWEGRPAVIAQRIVIYPRAILAPVVPTGVPAAAESAGIAVDTTTRAPTDP